VSTGISRELLQRLAEAKISDAQLLFENGRWGNAYYLAGYGIELALKSCAAKQFAEASLPDRALVNKLYSHKLADLVGAAGLSAELKAQQDADSTFAAYWGIVAQWTSDARYDSTDKSNAHYLLTAIGDRTHGVLAWIRTYW
jgi:hypothetical protein